MLLESGEDLFERPAATADRPRGLHRSRRPRGTARGVRHVGLVQLVSGQPAGTELVEDGAAVHHVGSSAAVFILTSPHNVDLLSQLGL